MFIVPTAKRFKSQTDVNPGRPIITGTASKAELESAAKRFGWSRRELSLKDYRKCRAERPVTMKCKSHPELHTKQIPHLVLEGFDRAERTFKSNHPEYIATKDARDKLLAQLQEWKMVISPQSLEAAWKHLVEKGELQIDKNKVVQGQAVRITDLGGQR